MELFFFGKNVLGFVCVYSVWFCYWLVVFGGRGFLNGVGVLGIKFRCGCKIVVVDVVVDLVVVCGVFFIIF